jgi:hypothetical protein
VDRTAAQYQSNLTESNNARGLAVGFWWKDEVKLSPPILKSLRRRVPPLIRVRAFKPVKDPVAVIDAWAAFMFAQHYCVCE